MGARDKVTARYFSEAGALTQTSAVGSQTVVEYIFMRISNTLQRGSLQRGSFDPERSVLHKPLNKGVALLRKKECAGGQPGSPMPMSAVKVDCISSLLSPFMSSRSRTTMLAAQILTACITICSKRVRVATP